GKSVDHALLPAEGPWCSGAEMLANRLRKNIRNIGRWAKRSGITCYRIYDADLPEYALAVDIYEGEQRWLHVQEYQAPKTIDPEKAKQRLRDALAVLPVIFEVPQARIALKLRRQQKGAQQYEKLDTQGGFFEVEENHCRYLVNLNDYLDTGLFLDHRIVRGLIGERARGKRFLNLFCYTGSATVTAAKGGAVATTSVDMSKTYLDWCGKNLALNGLNTQDNEMILANCVSWIKTAKWLRREFDLIFLDPPTFSNSKSMEDVFDVQRDHVELINGVLDLLAPEGMLIFSTNFRKFKMDQQAIHASHITDISRKTRSKDFVRNSRIHYCWELSR
ncbi:MAG TPA: bifunctional 23S rRNA (guanine(2069)-N(7))-methyltransferase RlmK/23S rRNA (guanine(2445)-N(2))-methyltransferase RlmL, partial [Gammaproteobacteria bacterium]|nr:bifunctional 23S rRNA (guanine(2069)-N(7))-methyltransferase RlmK/23S rRNA (guanine(2445)-N(2))-methyltransferase RlmL [Gammaproteobacteria bacterium]